LISGHAPEAQRIEGFRTGADGFLAKPYSERELRALIDSMLKAFRERSAAVRREAYEEAERRALAERAVLLESTTDAFFALDPNWRFTYLNQRALDYFRRNAGELLGRVIWEVFPVAKDTRLEKEYVRALAEQRSVTCELISPVTGRWVDVRASPTAQGLAVHFRDITSRKRSEQDLKEALTRLALATSVAGLGVFTWDVRTDELTLENKRAREIVEAGGRAPLTGRGVLKQLVHQGDRPSFRRELIRSMRSRRTLRITCRVASAAGSLRWVEINAGFEHSAEGALERLVGVLNDVTARRLTEDSLREADRRKDEFLALLAHELRNPLAPIANGMQVLNARASSDPIAQRMLDIMNRQLNHLVRLVDDLLDVSRITHGKIQLRKEPVSLPNL